MSEYVQYVRPSIVIRHGPSKHLFLKHTGILTQSLFTSSQPHDIGGGHVQLAIPLVAFTRKYVCLLAEEEGEERDIIYFVSNSSTSDYQILLNCASSSSSFTSLIMHILKVCWSIYHSYSTSTDLRNSLLPVFDQRRERGLCVCVCACVCVCVCVCV